MRQRRLLLYGHGIMMSLHSIFCKVDANSNKLFVLLKLHSSFLFQYRLLTMTTFFEIAVYTVYMYIYIYKWINGRQVVVPDKNSAQCLKAELYINKSGVKDDTWIFL